MSEGSGPPPRSERPASDRPERSGGGGSDRPSFGGGGGGGGGYGGDRGGDRGDRPRGPRRDGERDRSNWSVKAKLRARARKKARKGKKRMFQRRKVCRFCADKKLAMSYREPKTLRLFISETGKVTPRRISGTCAKHQRSLAVEIKRARHIALLPLAPNHM